MHLSVRLLGVLCALALSLAIGPVRAQDPTPVPIVPVARLISPIKDQEARGTVVIQGSAVSPLFARYEIAFAPEPDAQNWTILGGNTQPVGNGVLLAWNTRPLADGAYALRLQVFNSDGTVSESIVRNVRLINQSAAASTSSQAAGETTAAAGTGRLSELDTARDALSAVTEAINRIPAAFVRGVRLALLALGAVVAYGVLKQIVLWAARRALRKPIDYGQ
jgi:hypothetical protein